MKSEKAITVGQFVESFHDSLAKHSLDAAVTGVK